MLVLEDNSKKNKSYATAQNDTIVENDEKKEKKAHRLSDRTRRTLKETAKRQIPNQVAGSIKRKAQKQKKVNGYPP